MAKKKLKYTDILPILTDQIALISIRRNSTGTSCLFSSYDELVCYLESTRSELVPSGITKGFSPKTALSMLLVSAKFNKEFTVTVCEVKYSNK